MGLRYISVALVLLASTSLQAAPIFFGPSAYLSTADTPAGFYAGGSATFVETFEDASLDGGITANAGEIRGPGSFRDSVDADDGAIDGFGTRGHTFVSLVTDPNFILFTFTGLPTAAGLVWTDGVSAVSALDVTFEAFGAGMISLGMIGPYALNDGLNQGQTAEDRFFGVQDAAGIMAIKITDVSDNFEVDHVQYGSALTIPEPTILALMGLGLAGIRYRRRHLKKA